MSGDDSRSGLSPSEEMLLRAVRADVEPDRSGQQVGRFELVALLGRGGMGVVYRARDTTLGRDVALKILTAAALADEGRRRRLLREARSGALADSPHIATVFEAGEADGLPFLAMELVEGRTLRDVLVDAGGRLPATRVLDVARQIARGLAVAHAAEIVHRDLKPENVMIDAAGTVKILDFGLAKLRAAQVGPVSESNSIDGLTHEGVVLGTPAYMSPEQGKGLAVDARSDVFSFGVVLYELLAGKRPFVGRTSVELLIAIDRDEPPALVAWETPSALADLVRRCLSKNPANRPANGAALVEALGTTDAGPNPRRRTVGRRLAFAAIVVGAISVFTYQARRAPPPAKASAPKTPLTGDDTKLACPILAVEGVPEPNGWLGAAAASRACKRMVAALGQRSARVLVPAELLGLPHTPRDDFPDRPFDAPDVRARTLDAARKRADAWLDGRVIREKGTLRIELELHGSNGSIARSSGEDPRLHRAIAQATDPLLRPDAIPPREPFEEFAPLVWSREPALAVALQDFTATVEAQDDLAWGLARIQPWRKLALAPAAPSFAFADARARRAPEPSMELEIDAGSPARLLATAGGCTSVEGRKKGLAALLAARRVETRPAVQRAYDLAIGFGLTFNGETDRGREHILPHLEADPIDVEWFVLALSALASPKGDRTVAAFLAWAPENAAAYDLPIEIAPTMPVEKRLEWTTRQYLLAPFSALAARKHVPTLVAVGRSEEARMVGAAALVRSESAHTGNIVLAMLDVGDGKVAAAARRLDETFGTIEYLGGDPYADGMALTAWTDAHRAKGDLDEALERLLTRFLKPKRMAIVTPMVAPISFACAHAKSRELLLRCVGLLEDALRGEVVRDVADDVRRAVRGLSAYAKGDLAKAAEEFRSLPPRVQLAMPIEPLDTPRDRELLLRNVDALLASRSATHAVPLLMPAIARWAFARGDKNRARLAAQRVVDAWSMLDVTAPAVDEMRKILDRT